MSKTKTGSNAQFTSAGKGLTVIGDHCYAYSGTFGLTQDSQTMLEFNTGKRYIIFDTYFTGPTSYSDPNSGREANFQISINGIVIAFAHTDTSEAYIQESARLRFLVPPLSLVKIEMDGNDTTGSYLSSVLMTGDVYG